MVYWLFNSMEVRRRKFPVVVEGSIWLLKTSVLLIDTCRWIILVFSLLWKVEVEENIYVENNSKRVFILKGMTGSARMHQENLTQVLWRLKCDVCEVIAPVSDDNHEWSDRKHFNSWSRGEGSLNVCQWEK